MNAESIKECVPMKETILMHRLKHRHVVGIYGYFIEPVSGSLTPARHEAAARGVLQPYFGMVLELCQSTVKVAAVDSEQLASSNLSQDSEWRLKLALQSATVISYLHSQVPALEGLCMAHTLSQKFVSQNPPIIHRDIKWQADLMCCQSVIDMLFAGLTFWLLLMGM